MRAIALDTETALIKKGAQAPELSCISVCEGSTVGLWHWTEGERAEALLSDPQVLIVGHTIEFDMAVLGANFPHLLPLIFAAYEADRIVCIAVREKLLDIAKGRYRGFDEVPTEEHPEGAPKLIKLGYSLEDLAQNRLNRALDKDTWRLRYGELRGLPLAQWPAGAQEYPKEDARATFDVYQAQEAERLSYQAQGLPDYLDDQFRQSRKAFWLRLTSVWGITTDSRQVHALRVSTERDREDAAKDLRASGLLRPDRTVRRRTGIVETEPGSRNTKLAAQRLVQAYAAKGLDYPRTDKGGVALDERACLDSGDALLAKYARFASLNTVLSKDVPALEQGLIHTRFESLLETGRTSSSGNAKKGGMNIQNVRRLPGVRECFVPRPGCVFVDCDWSGAELGTLGQVCLRLLGWSTLAQALNEGKDPHLMVAAQLMGLGYEVVKARYDQGPGPDHVNARGVKCHCDYCRIDDSRQVGKIANFGYPGGLGAKTFVEYALANYGVRVTLDRAKELKRAWKQSWPEMDAYFKLITHVTEQNFPIIEQLFSGRWRGGVSFTEACNTLFQGLASDMANDAGWMIARACYVDTASPLWGFRIVNFIHDEFILEGPEERGHEAAQELARLMKLAAQRWVPEVTIKAKPLLMRRWSKGAKAVNDNNGRLIPWGEAA